MLSSILIVADYKENYIKQTIKSCLNQTYKRIEILVGYSYLSNIGEVKKIFLSNKLKFFKIKRKYYYPTQDQIYKIKFLLKKSKGKYIFLLDGDDLFLKDKITYILNNKNIKKNLITDNFLLKKNNLVKIVSKKNYKKNYIFKKFFNSWPDKIITSTISLPRKLIEDFFKNNKTFLWKFLAIDVQLIIYYSLRNNFRKTEKVLTIKNEHEKNLDKKFSNILSKVYWKRRLEQHQYYYSLTKKKSIEYYICFYINFFLNLVNDVNKRYI
jgi:glycosyltransferase involved in cell wall biosynthesis